MSDRPNFLFICADELTRNALNCYGTGFVKSPNLDRLARGGLRFTNAYTSSPLCVPSRAAMATGRYVHQVRCWDNGHPYHGQPEGWAHRLRHAGYRTVSIGKNHYRSTTDDNGFDEELLPMHVRGGIGDLFGMLRREGATYPSERVPAAAAAPAAEAARRTVRGPAMMAEVAGPGESNHTEYDRSIASAACARLGSLAREQRPWALYVSFVAPHFPLVAPKEFFDLYDPPDLPQPVHYAPAERPVHPVVNAMTRMWNYDDFFTPEKVMRARAGYYGLISFLDHHVGLLVAELERSGAAGHTVILFTSDHGEMLGNKGIWSTSAMYEESVGIPLILAGPGIRAGVDDRLVSNVDLAPTILGLAGVPDPGYEGPGHSVLAPPPQSRAVLSEYHAGASITGCFMLRTGRWKYVYYPGYEPQLFDLVNDPLESRDLGTSAELADIRSMLHAQLHGIVDPDAANDQAFADQATTVALHGGAEAIKKKGHPGEHAIDRRLGVE